MAAAETVKGKEPRANAWAKIDDELIEDAVAVPYDWEKAPSTRMASNVARQWIDARGTKAPGTRPSRSPRSK